jgi:hypothetical protein
VSSTFDRVSPRSARATGTTSAGMQDAEGKRALFSTDPMASLPALGSGRIECLRCEGDVVVSALGLLRTLTPSLHLGLRVGHGDDVRTVSVLRHDYSTYLRCPSCHRPSWVRFTLQI